MRFIKILTAAVCLFAFLAVACAPAPAPQIPASPPPAPQSTVPPTPLVARTTYPLTLQDSAGRSVVFKGAPKRIISLSPAHTEILYAIGAGDALVGADTYSDFPEAAQKLEKVGYSKIDLERVVGLSPDFIFAATRQKNVVPEMEKLGLTVLYFTEPETVDEVFEHIRMLSKIADRQPQGEELIASMQKRIAAVQAKLEAVDRGPSYFYELTPNLFTAGPKSFIGDMFSKVKGRNIVTDPDKPFPQISLESLVASDPQVIVLADSGAFGGESPESVKARPGWENVSAVKNSRIYPVDPALVSRPGPRIVEGIELLAKLLYPDRFQ